MNSPALSNNSRRKIEFDKKLKQIETDERKLKDLEQTLTNLRTRMSEETRPIVEEFCKLRVENLTKLRELLHDPKAKKRDTGLMKQFMVQLAVGLQEAGDPRAEEFLDELIPQEPVKKEPEFQQEERTHKFIHPKEQEKESEGKIEIKSLFRQLAKAFHPDKEPLEHLKDEKTSLMKKITAAYENQDLYGLLKLEKEHLGPRELTEDKMELYIKHINDRLKGLKSLEASLKKHGPLSTIYRFIYSRKATIQEYNIQNELGKIEAEVEKERELQTIIWDRSSLRDFLRS